MNIATFAIMTEDAVFSGFGLTISIDGAVCEIWHDSRQVHPSIPESFGILIGAREENTGSCRIERVTTPGKRDIQSRSNFLLQDARHQKTVNQAFNRSDGYLGYLGTWHTHPEPIPTPSAVDINDWLACVERNPDRKLYFVIVGTEKNYVFTKQGGKFKKLKELWGIKS